MPIDLKRQGRAEVHIPLFYPHEPDEIRQMFRAMAKKNKLALADDAIPPVDVDRRLSGADIESIVLAVKRQAMTAGTTKSERADIEKALAEFIPSAQGWKKSCKTSSPCSNARSSASCRRRRREQIAAPNGRSRLQERMAAIRQLLEQ